MSESTSNGEDRSIVAERLTRTFGRLTAVDEVDLVVPSGEIFGFLGPNGAGKSTLVRVLTTILAPTEGRATVAGHDVAHEGDKVRCSIGVALQDVGLDGLMTARELLVLQGRVFGMPAAEARSTADELLAMVGLGDVDPGKKVRDYSGGMRRRLDLALALVHRPGILFLDEPTTGLDPVSRATIWDEVRRLNRDDGVTIFLTTQYLEEADRLADHVAIIDKGRIVAEGTPSELKREIGAESVTLTFADPDMAERAAGVLDDLAETSQSTGAELVLYVASAGGLVAEIVRRLDGADVPLQGLELSTPSLDDVFLRATGTRLSAAEKTRDNEPEAAESPSSGRASIGGGVGS